MTLISFAFPSGFYFFFTFLSFNAYSISMFLDRTNFSSSLNTFTTFARTLEMKIFFFNTLILLKPTVIFKLIYLTPTWNEPIRFFVTLNVFAYFLVLWFGSLGAVIIRITFPEFAHAYNMPCSWTIQRLTCASTLKSQIK